MPPHGFTACSLTSELPGIYPDSSCGFIAADACGAATGKEDALIALATEFNLPDPMSGDWGVEGLDPLSVTGFAGPRMAFKTGFFEADPLSEAASAMSNPEPLVQTAEGLGLPAGSSVVNTGSVGGIEPQPVPEECGCAAGLCIQDAIAAGVDAKIADPELEFEAVEIIAYEAWMGGEPRFFCCPGEWTRWEGAWTPWVCTSQWRYIDTIPQTGGTDACVYIIDIERRKERIRIKRCLNCITISRRQTQIQLGTMEHREFVPRGTPCPTLPQNPPNCNPAAGPSAGYDVLIFPWTPALPPC